MFVVDHGRLNPLPERSDAVNSEDRQCGNQPERQGEPKNILVQSRTADNPETPPPREYRRHKQECRYLVKDFGTSQSPKSTRQRDSRYCPD
ncbi:MAG: hypothetical protein AB2807_03885, partial [Candidatus Sedimenticola endophacoides]